uniref:Uncharacterized protein n=1 Tax=Siphoviridae sp. ctJLl6 TaxID=2827836 RepID=A0A8S5SAY3_9CAUD|nr:MAG TPA: hypothetical protein [Siphoviridae sp. ctJLl6]
MENTEKELNLEQKVTVRSIAPWTTGFQRVETIGDVTIPANGSVRLSRSEIIAQVQNGNVLFTGVDSRGSHATLYIEDEPTRIEVDFDIKEEKITQKVITVDAVKKLFGYKTMKTFEEKLKELVLTRAEKHAIANIIRKEKINDHEKVKLVENYTGVSI